MTETTTTFTTAKTTKPDPSPFSLRNYVFPKFDLPQMEVVGVFREIAEKGIAHAKDTCEKAKTVAEEATDLLKDTYTTASEGVSDYNLKIIEIAHTNANLIFVCARNLLGVKSPSEFVKLSTVNTRKQFEAMSTQIKELVELAQKITTETAAHGWRHGDTKAFKKVA